MDLETVDAPVRDLFERIAGPAARAEPDLPAIGDALAGLAADTGYLATWIERLHDAGGSVPIHAPERGPRLMLVHRLEGQMSAVHDHGTWVALAGVSGLETHRRYRVRDAGAGPRPELAEARTIAPRETVTLLPPDDLHDHGHLPGFGEPAFVLIVTGDDQRRYERTEWDLATGRQRVLRPGVGGRWIAGEPVPPDADR